ncbi:hypothetical protein Slin15195_G122040 [Septoria linicola]|uniref:Secreted protein n=1 Tax=Septoria linicola TaxID=215465 RepID=A0A9Q9B620_9PEZI|nr:hypothetical protein Slin14017_G078250 [Septoria linicola]USW58885.1 hypothetical protein Slin15195_G122040 [Septoria linicola]
MARHLPILLLAIASVTRALPSVGSSAELNAAEQPTEQQFLQAKQVAEAYERTHDANKVAEASIENAGPFGGLLDGLIPNITINGAKDDDDDKDKDKDKDKGKSPFDSWPYPPFPPYGRLPNYGYYCSTNPYAYYGQCFGNTYGLKFLEGNTDCGDLGDSDDEDTHVGQVVPQS